VGWVRPRRTQCSQRCAISDEYNEHVYGGKCRARVCKGLIHYEIIPELCTGCLVCLRNCAQNAITGEKLKPHLIHDELCGKCGVCKELCKFDAVKVMTGNGHRVASLTHSVAV
jgi:MinD superfamily P-loop ATPase